MFPEPARDLLLRGSGDRIELATCGRPSRHQRLGYSTADARLPAVSLVTVSEQPASVAAEDLKPPTPRVAAWQDAVQRAERVETVPFPTPARQHSPP